MEFFFIENDPFMQDYSCLSIFG